MYASVVNREWAKLCKKVIRIDRFNILCGSLDTLWLQIHACLGKHTLNAHQSQNQRWDSGFFTSLFGCRWCKYLLIYYIHNILFLRDTVQNKSWKWEFEVFQACVPLHVLVFSLVDFFNKLFLFWVSVHTVTPLLPPPPQLLNLTALCPFCWLVLRSRDWIQNLPLELSSWISKHWVVLFSLRRSKAMSR